MKKSIVRWSITCNPPLNKDFLKIKHLKQIIFYTSWHLSSYDPLGKIISFLNQQKIKGKPKEKGKKKKLLFKQDYSLFIF